MPVEDMESAVEHYNLGVQLRRAGRTDKAIAEFTAAIQRFPSLASAYFNRANAYAEKEMNEAALRDFERTETIDPKHYKSLCNHGLLLVKMGAFSKALPLLDRAAELGDVKAQQSAEGVRRHLAGR